MSWLGSTIVLVALIGIAASREVILHRKAVARDEYRFASARTIEHEPIVAELRRAGAI